ncbi:hypothetical protein ACFLYR_05950 [Chloroflexota bacterium]
MAIIYTGTIYGIVYLIIEYIFKVNLSFDLWISVIIAIFIASFILRTIIAYWGIARRLLPGERIERCLISIAELREICVNTLLNYPMEIKTEEDLNILKDKFITWHQSLIPAIERVSPSQASTFKVLGTFTLEVPKGGFNTLLEAKEAHLKGIIIEYTKRLKDMIDIFSLENLSNRVTK